MKKCILVYGCVFFLVLFCEGNKQSSESKSLSGLPPVVSVSALPEFIHKYRLYYPGSEIHKAENVFLLKTFDESETVEKFYKDKAQSAGFSPIAVIRQTDGVLLQYRNDKESAVISVDIQKLPYAKNRLIRLAFSKTDTSVIKE